MTPESFVALLPGVSLPSGETVLFSSLLLLSHVLPLGDALDVCARFYLKRLHTAGSRGKRCPSSILLHAGPAAGAAAELRPYAIVASVHNVEGRLADFLDSFGACRDRFWLVDDHSDDATLEYLAREGVRAMRTDRNRKKPAALRELLGKLPPEIVTVLVVDPDVTIADGGRNALESAITRFQQSGCAAACPRITVQEQGMLSYLQALEYDLAMLLGRASLGDFCVTSGIALYRREALSEILELHSLSVYAEDLENAFLLLSRGERIYFDGELEVQAQCPSTLPHLFSQRVGWAYGLVRAYASSWRDLWRARRGPGFVYQYFGYLGLLSIALQPLRAAAALLIVVSAANTLDNLLALGVVPDGSWSSPYYFIFAYVQYSALLLAVVAVVGDQLPRARHFLVAPLYFAYALFLTLPVTVGFLNWLCVRTLGRRLYRDHYADSCPSEAVLQGTP